MVTKKKLEDRMPLSLPCLLRATDLARDEGHFIPRLPTLRIAPRRNGSNKLCECGLCSVSLGQYQCYKLYYNLTGSW
jgi:hypothetical protein